MNGWLLVGALAAIIVVVVLAVTRTRPRTAEELLAVPAGGAQPPVPSAAPAELKDVISSLVARKATGLLTVKKGSEVCSISMLFGHIFDASCGMLQGEDALRHALNWSNPDCQFDATSRLTTNETITTPTRSLLESLERNPPLPPP